MLVVRLSFCVVDVSRDTTTTVVDDGHHLCADLRLSVHRVYLEIPRRLCPYIFGHPLVEKEDFFLMARPCGC